MNAFILKEWWQYRRAARGRHGVHSPFVYRLIDQGLCAHLPETLLKRPRGVGRPARERKVAKLIYQCLAFLNATPEIIYQQEFPLLTDVTTTLAAARRDQLANSHCIVLTGNPEECIAAFAELVGSTRQGHFFIVPDIHTTPEKADMWNQLHEDPHINLSIDLWYIGLLFYSPDFKEHQHFVLKHHL